MRLPPLKAGIYRHYRGPLYLVLGYAHDANADTLANWVSGPFPVEPLDERFVVVYVGLQLDEARTGPRMAVRTVEDFFAHVDPENGSPVPEAVAKASLGSVRAIEEQGYVPRFQYVGPSYEVGFG